MRAKFTNQN